MKKIVQWIGPWAAVLMLIYTIYYLAMQSTGGILDAVDLAVALPVAVLCVVVLVYKFAAKE